MAPREERATTWLPQRTAWRARGPVREGLPEQRGGAEAAGQTRELTLMSTPRRRAPGTTGPGPPQRWDPHLGRGQGGMGGTPGLAARRWPWLRGVACGDGCGQRVRICLDSKGVVKERGVAMSWGRGHCEGRASQWAGVARGGGVASRGGVVWARAGAQSSRSRSGNCLHLTVLGDPEAGDLVTGLRTGAG